MPYQQEFKKVLQDAGIPTTQLELEKQWQETLKEQGFEINNQSPFSPFWRLQSALVGKPAMQLIDALITQVMPNTFVLLAKDKALDIKGNGRNTERLSAVKAQGNIVLTRTDNTSELIIPMGTVIESTPVNGIVYQLFTLFTATFNAGDYQVTALCEAENTGSAFNLSGGYYSKLLNVVEGVTVLNTNNWLVSAGQDIESNDNYRLRIRDKFATLGNYHVDAVYRGIISEFPGVQSDNVVFEHTAPRGAGSANAYAFLEVGQISQSVIDEINNHIASGYHGHGDDLLVFAMPTQAQTIAIEMWQKPNTANISNAVKQFIGAAFRENSAYTATLCLPNNTFSFSLLAAELHAQFPEIKTLNFTNDDINTGVWLPVINVINLVNHV
jgi:uncharacterized phage protein gp47/JayE